MSSLQWNFQISQLNALQFSNKIPKTITYHAGVFRHHVHHSARNFDSSFNKTYIAQGDHFMFNWRLDWTFIILHISGLYSHGCFWSRHCLLMFYASYACPRPHPSYITGVIMDIRHIFFQLSNDRMWLILSEIVECFSYCELKFYINEFCVISVDGMRIFLDYYQISALRP